MEENKAIVIVVNKWDLIEHGEKSMQEFAKKIRAEFKFLDYAPIVFVSAKDKTRIQTIFRKSFRLIVLITSAQALRC